MPCGYITPMSASSFTWPLPCVSVSFPSLRRTFIVGFRANIGNPGWSHLQLLNLVSQRHFFQIRSHSQIQGHKHIEGMGGKQPFNPLHLLFLVCWVILIWKSIEFCRVIFLCLLRWSHDFFLSFYWYMTLIDFQILSQCFIPGIYPTWSWCIILSICCWIRFTNILLNIFATIFIKDIDL